METAELIQQLHNDNIVRFEALDRRLTILETQWAAGLSILKWFGGAGVALLLLNWVSVLLK